MSKLGQLLVLLIAIPLLALLFRFVVEPRIGTILISALVAHTAWHWMIDRGEQLLRFPFPVIDAAAVAAILRWMMVIVASAGRALVDFRRGQKRWEAVERLRERQAR